VRHLYISLCSVIRYVIHKVPLRCNHPCPLSVIATVTVLQVKKAKTLARILVPFYVRVHGDKLKNEGFAVI